MKNYAFQLWWSDLNFVVPNKIIITIKVKIIRTRRYSSFTQFYKFIKTCLWTRKQENTLQLISHFLKSSTPASLWVLRQSSRSIQIKRASRNGEQRQSALAFFSCSYNIFALIQRNPASQHNRKLVRPLRRSQLDPNTLSRVRSKSTISAHLLSACCCILPRSFIFNKNVLNKFNIIYTFHHVTIHYSSFTIILIEEEKIIFHSREKEWRITQIITSF
jgi:hypothetical protein